MKTIAPIRTSKLLHCKGFNLLETLIVSLIVSIVLSMAIPSYESIKAKLLVKQTAMRLQNNFSMIKSYATLNQVEVIICGTLDKRTCQKDWSRGYMSFEDTNKNRQRDDNEKILSFEKPFKKNTDYAVKSCSRRYFRTSAAGPMASIAGTIAISAPEKFKQSNYRLYISRIGRTRLTKKEADTLC